MYIKSTYIVNPVSTSYHMLYGVSLSLHHDGPKRRLLSKAGNGEPAIILFSKRQVAWDRGDGRAETTRTRHVETAVKPDAIGVGWASPRSLVEVFGKGVPGGLGRRSIGSD